MQSYRLLLPLSALVLAKVLVIIFVGRYTRVSTPQHNYSYEGLDYPLAWQIPEPQTVRMFIEDTVRYQMDELDSAAEWEALVPNHGIIYLGDQRRPFSIAMFHQLRCLDVFRQELIGAHRSANGTHPPSDLSRHCLNYLRQMILCRSDLRLDALLGEPKVQAFPDTYECRDWELIYQEVASNQMGVATDM
jgi:hypothetical protein